MLFDHTVADAPRAWTTTAFREDGSAELVTISRLGFDSCELSSAARFAVGERLRLYLRGQGLVVLEVERGDGDDVTARMVTECDV